MCQILNIITDFYTIQSKEKQYITTYESPGPPALLANLGAVIPDKIKGFSGGGAPEGALIITESPDKT